MLCFDLRPGPQKMLFQEDAPEGSDTFQWPVIDFKDPVGDRVGVELLFNSVEFESKSS